MAPMNGKTLARMHDPTVKHLREDTAMRYYAQGMTQMEISRVMEVAQPQVSKMIRRALDRHSKNDKIVAGRARALIMQRLEGMFSAWYPHATGAIGDAPNEKAAEIVLKVLDRIAKISGVGDLATTINVNVTTANADVIRAEISRDLDALAERQQRIIEGTFEVPDEQ